VGILASHHQNYEPLMTSPILIDGTNQMLVLWLVAIIVSGIAALVPSARSACEQSGVYFIMITLAFAQMIYLLRHFLAGLWRRGWPFDLCPKLPFPG
jgi:branched-chain amino acid transport system permease protein